MSRERLSNESLLEQLQYAFNHICKHLYCETYHSLDHARPLQSDPSNNAKHVHHSLCLESLKYTVHCYERPRTTASTTGEKFHIPVHVIIIMEDGAKLVYYHK